VVRQNTGAKEVYRKSGYADHDHYLMSKWIERSFPKPRFRRPRVTWPPKDVLLS
jgi:hypothetical protein